MANGHYPGARWIRCDLHVHTPFDPEKKFGENIRHAVEAFKKERPQKLAEIATRFIESCRATCNGEGIDLIALTDHNSVEGFRYLKPQFETIGQQAKNEGLKMPLILPGVEFSVGGERPLHFLTIFASNTNLDDIDRLVRFVFGEREPFDPKTGTPRATGQSISEFLERFYRFCRPDTGERHLRFVLLPAHADGSRGLAKETDVTELSIATSLWDEMRGHLRQWAVARKDWNGFETSRPFDKLPLAFRELLFQWAAVRRGEEWQTLSETDKNRYRTQQHWALLECSDPHNHEAIGSRYTWLKMEVPDVEGIRLALLDPESRLRRMLEAPPRLDYPRIESIRIKHTDFFDSISIPLNPCLNTLIGGRGSGKSTVIEYLRYASDRNRPEDFSGTKERQVRETVEDLLETKPARDYGETKGTLLPEHEIEIDVRISNRLYKVRRTAAAAEVIPDPDQKGSISIPLDVRSLIAPRILSQGQIASIARDPAAQRRELDALVGSERIREFEDRRQVLVDLMKQLQLQRSRLRDRGKLLPSRETELLKVEDQIRFLEEGGRKETLTTFQTFQREEGWLKQVQGAIESTAQEIDDLASSTRNKGSQLAAPPPGPSEEWTYSVEKKVTERLNAVEAVLRQQVASLRDLLATVKSETEQRWVPGFKVARSEYESLRAEMEKKGVQFAQHEKLLQQRALLEREIKDLRGIKEQIELVEKQISEARTKLLLLHEERLFWRRDQAKALEQADADVRLEVHAFSDKKELTDKRDEWFSGAGLQDRDWTTLLEYVWEPNGLIPDRLAKLAAAVRSDVDATRTAGRALDTTKSTVAALLGSKGGPLTGHYFRALQREERIRIDDMERFIPEDDVEAKVRGSDGIFKPIGAGSIGQRSTAVLSLLLSAGSQPLVIDQPESDLDNKYVYDVVVDLLRKRKFFRQIIIATHNANIPVNGDAELIIAMGVQNREGAILDQGSIDSATVKQNVSIIMEGSPEAFRLRQERYGY